LNRRLKRWAEGGTFVLSALLAVGAVWAVASVETGAARSRLILAVALAIGAGGAGAYGLFLLRILRPLRRVLLGHRPSESLLRPRELDVFLRRFATQAGALKEAGENLQTLLNASRSIVSEASIQEIYNQVVDLVWKRVDRAPCLLWMQDKDGFLRIKYFRNFSPDLVQRLHVQPSEGFLGRAFESRFPQVVPDAAAVPEYLDDATRRSLDVTCAAHFPLEIDGKSAGALTVYAAAPGFFSEDRLEMISTLMEYLSLAAQNARLYEGMEAANRRMASEVSSTSQELTVTNLRLIQRVRELRLLHDATRLTVETPHLDAAAATILDQMARLINVEKTGLFLAEGESFVARASGFAAEAGVPAARLAPWRSALQAGEAVALEDAEAAKVFPQTHGLLLSPLLAGEKLLGFLAAGNKRHGVFEEEDRRLLLLLARHLADILWNIQLAQDREAKLRDLTALQEVASVISGEPDLNETLRRMVQIIVKSLSADLCAFMLYDQATEELVTQPGAHGLPEQAALRLPRAYVKDPASASGRVFSGGAPFLSPDVTQDPTLNPRLAGVWGARSLLIVPLTVENRCIGVLRLGHAKTNHFTQDHLRLAGLIAEEAAVIVQNAKLYGQVQANVQELKQLDRLKTEFISVVSHELRTPITIVKGFIALLLNKKVGPLTGQQEKFLGLANQSIDRLSVLINDLLDISRVEAGRLEIHPVSLDMAAMLREAAKDHAVTAAKKKIDLDVQAAKTVAAVKADPNRIRQVIDNLIGNALKFTPEGGRVTLTAREDEEIVHVGVHDTGIGIPETEWEKIFEKFYQLNPAATRHARGAGLGLAICRSLVQLHGGKIWVESKVDEGSHFQFSLPRSKKGPAKPAARTEKPRVSGSRPAVKKHRA